jgi:hypothetical protein
MDRKIAKEFLHLREWLRRAAEAEAFLAAELQQATDGK